MLAVGLERDLKRTSIFRKVGRALIYCGLLASLLPAGSTSAIPFLLSCIPIALAALAASLSPPSNAALRTSFNWCLGLSVALSLLILFQACSFENNPFENPIWQKTASMLGTHGGAISVEPSATIQALLTLLAPLLTYACVISHFEGDRASFRLIKALALLGAAFAAFGLIQIVFLRESLLFSEKTAYLSDLTSILVNRNTAGTFLGVASLAICGWLMATVQETGGRAPLRRLLANDGVPLERRRRAAALAFLFLLTVTAMFLTRSRGAMLSALAAYGLITPLMFLNVGGSLARSSDRSSNTPDVRRLGMAVIAVMAVLIAANFLGQRSTARLAQEGADVTRLCVYAATLDAFKDNWVFGTGFGTFASVFPQYRDAECANFYGVFLRAHNFFLEGLLGLGIAFVPILFFAYWHTLSNLIYGYRNRHRMRFAPIIGMGGVLLVTLHGLSDFSLQIPGMASYFACFLGAATSISLAKRRADAAPHSRRRRKRFLFFSTGLDDVHRTDPSTVAQ